MGILKVLVVVALSLGISITSVLATDANCPDIANGANTARNVPNLDSSREEDGTTPQRGRGATAVDRQPTSVTPTTPATPPAH